MKKYYIDFIGRTKNAIGIKYAIIDYVFAENEEKAVLKLYDNYEHIRVNYIKEVQNNE